MHSTSCLRMESGSCTNLHAEEAREFDLHAGNPCKHQLGCSGRVPGRSLTVHHTSDNIACMQASHVPVHAGHPSRDSAASGQFSAQCEADVPDVAEPGAAVHAPGAAICGHPAPPAAEEVRLGARTCTTSSRCAGSHRIPVLPAAQPMAHTCAIACLL